MIEVYNIYPVHPSKKLLNVGRGVSNYKCYATVGSET